ncbi:MAG TPA: hypothetical protein VKV21_08370 [Solirubrobacteraceae bacterium]|nr:hypothetical protein [Solirubrobacteraceae bacterium]
MTNAEIDTDTKRLARSSAAAMETVAGPKEVSMNSRFLTNAALTLAGAFTVVASMAWGTPTFMWLMFVAGIVAVGLSLAAAVPGRGLAQRSLDGAIAILGAWTIVASLVFAGATVTWLGFASGIGFVALALAGLALHELRTERVVHAFELRTPASERTNERAYTPVNG